MKRVALVAVLLSGFFLITGQPAMADHFDATYQITAEQTTAPGFTSTYCLHFLDQVLTIESPVLPPVARTLVYRHGDLDTDENTFQAVTGSDGGTLTTAVMVYGRFLGKADRNGSITGEGVDEIGISYKFRGFVVLKPLTCPTP